MNTCNAVALIDVQFKLLFKDLADVLLPDLEALRALPNTDTHFHAQAVHDKLHSLVMVTKRCHKSTVTRLT